MGKLAEDILENAVELVRYHGFVFGVQLHQSGALQVIDQPLAVGGQYLFPCTLVDDDVGPFPGLVGDGLTVDGINELSVLLVNILIVAIQSLDHEHDVHLLVHRLGKLLVSTGSEVTQSGGIAHHDIADVILREAAVHLGVADSIPAVAEVSGKVTLGDVLADLFLAHSEARLAEQLAVLPVVGLQIQQALPLLVIECALHRGDLAARQLVRGIERAHPQLLEEGVENLLQEILARIGLDHCVGFRSAGVIPQVGGRACHPDIAGGYGCLIQTRQRLQEGALALLRAADDTDIQRFPLKTRLQTAQDGLHAVQVAGDLA